MIKKITTLFLSLGMFVTSQAQQAERFSVATLNIDGLPQKILFVNSNPDGPGGPGTVRIAKYLKAHDYDMVFIQEDFSYHGELAAVLEEGYGLDAWSGTVGIDIPGKKIDFLHLQNLQFDCDGLMGAWKHGITVNGGVRKAWTDGFGKFSHANDLMVTKGYRRYEATLASGSRVVIYNLHMDAEMEEDSEEGKAGPDRAARLNQWKQLCDEVMLNMDERPIIILGDFNTFYFRDKAEEAFINVINASGKASVEDVWVQLRNNGQYPAYREDDRTRDDREEEHGGETLDKVLYINPYAAGKLLRPTSYERDMEGYKYDGKPLGDHYPVAVTFELVNAKGSDASGISGITSLTGSGETPEYYNLSGQRVTIPANGVYIERIGKIVRKRSVK